MQESFSKFFINSSPFEPGVMTIHSSVDNSFLKKSITDSKFVPFTNRTLIKQSLNKSKSFVLLGSYQKILKYLKLVLNSFS